ncbi:MAG TPA: diguanylate cyclase [Pyrinomonadaceae bacterium]
MLSLYQALLYQHPRQLTPVRCAEQTITQLHYYFEDVVLENSLAALVVESLPGKVERSARGVERVFEIARAADQFFLFVAPDDALHKLPLPAVEDERAPVLLPRQSAGGAQEHFILIADARFSALLVTSLNTQTPVGADPFTEHEVIWTFEPDIVYSALEYLMARVTAERFAQTGQFAAAVRRCMPKATSLQLTVSVTTKLARLLQEQAAREVAVNRIASAIRSTLEVPSIMQTAVDEVGRALGAQHCALRVEGELEQTATTKFYCRAAAPDEATRAALLAQLDASHTHLFNQERTPDHAGAKTSAARADGTDESAVAVPLICQETYVGTLLVRTDDARRVWQKSERLLLRTVADQLALAVSHARLFTQIQQQALTDALTGCVNRRAFDMQLERDLRLAARMHQALSLVMLDIDHFKQVNDTHGHDAGDAALRFLAEILRAELRAVDTAARYGGEEFAIILPQAGLDGALLVAERLRARLEQTNVPGIGHITASFGLAAFPQHASASAQLVTLADRALYEAKHAGRNRICMPPASLDVTEAKLAEATAHLPVAPEIEAPAALVE